MSLLGSVVTTTFSGVSVSVRLNEVEAYRGRDDPASHAHRGRTVRNGPMYGPAGTVYVYLSYGIHWCMNVITGREDDPQGVLLRGGVVVEGVEFAMNRRRRSDHLADGPGRLGQALGVTGELSGVMLNTASVSIAGLGAVQDGYIATPRIGISRGKDLLWRFVAQTSHG